MPCCVRPFSPVRLSRETFSMMGFPLMAMGAAGIPSVSSCSAARGLCGRDPLLTLLLTFCLHICVPHCHERSSSLSFGMAWCSRFQGIYNSEKCHTPASSPFRIYTFHHMLQTVSSTRSWLYMHR